MSKVVILHPCKDVAGSLRRLADRIDAGEFAHDAQCTVVFDLEVFHWGCVDTAETVTGAVFNLNYGAQLLMQAVIDAKNGG